MLPILASLLASLASNGLGLLAGAIQAKGKEVIEDKLGIKIPENLSPELLQELKKKEMEHEEFLISIQVKQAEMDLKSEEIASQEVTKRWEADTATDSWLAKNIRPMVLIYIFTVYALFALLSAFALNVNAAYIELLSQWGIIVMSAYFVGRTIEKGLSIKGKKDEP